MTSLRSCPRTPTRFKLEDQAGVESQRIDPSDEKETTAEGRLNLRYACCTQAGLADGVAKENQDAWVVQEHLTGTENVMFGVFDGHGQEGQTVSNIVAEALPELIGEVLSKLTPQQLANPDPELLRQCMVASFKQCNRTLCRIRGLDCNFSGSTGVVAIASPTHISISNLGDSRCILGRVAPDGSARAYDLTNDHKPEQLAEANRVLAAGGRIAAFSYQQVQQGPLRVWLRDRDTPGLAMTRSFGDLVAASVGVIDVPEVLQYEMMPEDRYLVLMSDGITEYMQTYEIIELVHQCATKLAMGPRKAAQHLVREARCRWATHYQGQVADDCTAIVVYMNSQDKESDSDAAGGRGWKAVNSVLKKGMSFVTKGGAR